MKLFLKGTKCFSDKCPLRSATLLLVNTVKTAKPKSWVTAATTRKAEGQTYVLYPGRAVRNYFEKAARTKGVTGELLLQQLERRLDSVVYRLGFGISRRQARQLVRHGHVHVDGRKVNIPSYEVAVGEEIAIRESSRKLAILEQAKEFASHQNAPNWMDIDRDNYKARVLALPKREDINLPVNEQLIVELYSK